MAFKRNSQFYSEWHRTVIYTHTHQSPLAVALLSHFQWLTFSQIPSFVFTSAARALYAILGGHP